MKVSRIVLPVLLISYAVLWCGGVASYLFWGGPTAGSGWTAPAFLFLAALLTLRLTLPGWRRQLLAAGVIGMAAEFAGLNWGYPFGSYSYTGVLHPSVLGVPVAIGCAWLILFAYVRQMLGWFKIAGWQRAVSGAFWMTALDWVIDPLAAGPLRYWSWTDAGWYYGVPAGNFAGWFLVSLILFLIFRQSPGRDRRVAYAGFSILLFFTLIAFRHLMIGPMMASAVLLALHLLLLHVRPRRPALPSHAPRGEAS